LRAAAQHRGTALVEIYQNCPIFNDGAFDILKDADEGEGRMLRLIDGEPVRAGEGDATRVVIRDSHGRLTLVPESEADPARVVTHDVADEDPSTAFALSRLDGADMANVPMGIFRSVQRPTYDDGVRAQVAAASPAGPAGDDELLELLRGKDTWNVAG